MSAALLESRPSLFAEARRSASVGGGWMTLEERLEAAWRAVQADGVAECPVCHARMRREGRAGRCTGCASTLA